VLPGFGFGEAANIVNILDGTVLMILAFSLALFFARS
jgi:hypothetical protein